jgi:hypothetical protein
MRGRIGFSECKVFLFFIYISSSYPPAHSIHGPAYGNLLLCPPMYCKTRALARETFLQIRITIIAMLV